MKKVTLLLIICFTLSCASIPHYKEVYTDSSSRIYQNYTLDDIWNVTLKILVEINYIIEDTDRAGGIILARKEHGHSGIVHITGSNQLMILIQNMDNNIVAVFCQSRVLNISAHPEEEINEFFESLNKNI